MTSTPISSKRGIQERRTAVAVTLGTWKTWLARRQNSRLASSQPMTDSAE